MTIELTHEADGSVRVEGEGVSRLPEPGVTCPTCGEPTVWVQGVFTERGSLAAYVLPLCQHEFSDRAWQLVQTGDRWSLRLKEVSRQHLTRLELEYWEDSVNRAFARVGSGERVCAHLDVTETLYADRGRQLSCDYCPSVTACPPGVPDTFAPLYYLDPERAPVLRR